MLSLCFLFSSAALVILSCTCGCQGAEWTDLLTAWNLIDHSANNSVVLVGSPVGSIPNVTVTWFAKIFLGVMFFVC